MLNVSTPSQTPTPEEVARDLTRRIDNPVGLLYEQETRLDDQRLRLMVVEALVRQAQQQPEHADCLLRKALATLAQAEPVGLEARAIGIEAKSLCRRYVRIEASRGGFATPLVHRLREWS